MEIIYLLSEQEIKTNLISFLKELNDLIENCDHIENYDLIHPQRHNRSNEKSAILSDILYIK